MVEEKGLLNYAQAALLLDVSTKRISELVRLRKLKPFDFLGFGAMILFIGAFQLMLDRGPSQDWFGSSEIWTELIITVTALWVFFVHTLSRLRRPTAVDVIIDERLNNPSDAQAKRIKRRLEQQRIQAAKKKPRTKKRMSSNQKIQR